MVDAFFFRNIAIAASMGAIAAATRIASRSLVGGGRSSGRATIDEAFRHVLHEVIGAEAVVDKAIRRGFDPRAFFRPLPSFLFALLLAKFWFALPIFLTSHGMCFASGGAVLVDAPITDDAVQALLADHRVRVFDLGSFQVWFPFALLVFQERVIGKELNPVGVGETADSREGVLHQNIALALWVAVEIVVWTGWLPLSSQIMEEAMVQKNNVKLQSLLVVSNIADSA